MVEDKPTRNAKGHFVKGGKSANPLGRPKTVVIPDIVLDAKAKELYKDNPLKALMYLMNSAKSAGDLFKYAKAIIDYTNPRLSAVKQEISKTETFIIERADGFKLGEMKSSTEIIDVTPMDKEDQQLQKDAIKQAKQVLKEKKT